MGSDMTKLPVFSTIGQAMAVFGLHIGKIFQWGLIVVAVGVVPVGVVFGFLEQSVKAASASDNPEAGLWLMLLWAALLWLALVMTPLGIKINQLAVFGRTQPIRYLDMLFSRRSLRFLGYTILVGLIFLAGFLLAFVPAGAGLRFAMEQIPAGSVADFSQVGPAIVHALAHSGGTASFGILVSAALGVAFAVLALPLQLVLPAVSVEENPSLGRSYNLASGNKLRLFCSMLLVVLFFLCLNGALILIGKAFGADQSVGVRLMLLPLNLIVMLFDVVTAKAVYAVAYRIFSGLPDPRSTQ